MVKVKVTVGSIHFEGGTFEKGEVFECTEAQLKQFGPNTILLLEDIAEAKTEATPEETKKTPYTRKVLRE